jgi:hypothetical protein
VRLGFDSFLGVSLLHDIKRFGNYDDAASQNRKSSVILRLTYTRKPPAKVILIIKSSPYEIVQI